MLLAILLATVTPHPMTVEDLWSMARVGAPEASPDGRWVAFTSTTYSMETNKANGDLWIVPSDGSAPPRRLTWNEESDGSPAFSPDGKRLAFTSKRGDKPVQLHVLPLDGGEAEPVSDLPVPPSRPRWLPDGSGIVFAAPTWPDLNDDFAAVKKRKEERDEDKTQAYATENRLVRYWDRWLTDGMVHHLFVLDLASRKVRDLTPGWARVMGLEDGPAYDLAPDGKEVAFSAAGVDPPYRTLQEDVFVVPIAGGTPKKLTADNPADDSRPRYSPDGRWLVWGRQLRPDHDPEFTKLVRYDRSSGAIAPLAERWDATIQDWAFAADGRSLVLTVEERGKGTLHVLPLASGGKPKLLATGGTLGGAEPLPDGRVVATLQTMTEPAELVVIPGGGGEARRITAMNAERLAGIARSKVEEVTYPGAGDTPVHMFVAYPPDFDPSKKWPAILILHGGPHGAWKDEFHYRWSAALFAAKGWVALLPNFHGSTGYGQAFAEAIVGAHGDKPFQDVMRGVDAMVAKGFVDEKRLVAAGGSYGGYLAAWLLGKTDRFAAIVNHAGVYDLMAQFASDATYGRSNNYGATPWEDPARIDRWSPSRFASGFKTPTLVLHGERDYRVPYTQGLNLHGVLTAKGVPSRLVVFPNENHWILKPQAARIWWSEVFGWMDRWAGAPGDSGSTGRGGN